MPNAAITTIAETLAGIHPFNILPATALLALAAGTRACRYSRHEIVCHGGRRAEGVHVVAEGEVKRFLLSPTGAEKIIQIATAGESFGEEAALLDRPHQTTTEVTRDSVLLLIGTAPLRAAMQDSPALNLALLDILSSRLYALVDNLQLCVQMNSTQRVAHYLAALAPGEAENCEIRLENDKQTIASQLNLTPETLSRALSRLTRDGMIRPRGRRSLMLTSVHRLRTCAAS